MWRYIESHESVAPLCVVIVRPQHIRCALYVRHRKLLVEIDRRNVAVPLRFLERAQVVAAGIDRLLEDRGVRSHPTEAVALDKSRQPALADEVARQEIEPYRSAGLRQRFEGVHRVC